MRDEHGRPCRALERTPIADMLQRVRPQLSTAGAGGAMQFCAESIRIFTAPGFGLVPDVTSKWVWGSLMRRVALLVETSNSYARGLLRGVVDYAREHGRWSVYLGEHRRGDQPPPWLERWDG